MARRALPISFLKRANKGVSFNGFIDLYSTTELLLATTDAPDSEIIKLSENGEVIRMELHTQWQTIYVFSALRP